MTPDETKAQRAIIEAATPNWEFYSISSSGGASQYHIKTDWPFTPRAITRPDGHTFIPESDGRALRFGSREYVYNEDGVYEQEEQRQRDIADRKFAVAARTGWPQALDENNKLRGQVKDMATFVSRGFFQEAMAMAKRLSKEWDDQL